MLSPFASGQIDGAESPAASLFKDNCAVCHGENGAGTELGKRLKTADLRGPKVHQMSPTEIAATIKSGKNNMPAFASKLTDEEIQQLVEYVRTFHAGAAKRSAKK